MDPLLQSQLDFAGRIRAEPWFADIALLEQRKGVVESDVEVALSTLNERGARIGACVVVLMPELEPKQENVAPANGDLVMTVQVVENPLFNFSDSGTHKAAEQISTRLRRLFHHFWAGEMGTWYLKSDLPVERPDGQVSRAVSFRCHHQDAAVEQCALPVIAVAGAGLPHTVTLTSATTGAQIWYSLDGSYPSPVEPTSALYTGPFAVAVPGVLRASATAATLQQSHVATTEFIA